METEPLSNTDEQALASLSTAQLIKHAMEEAKLFAQAEVLHAKHELREEVAAAKRAGILLGAAGVLALCCLSALFVALGLALPMAENLGVVLVGVVLLLVAGVCFLLGRRALPKKPLPRTVDRLKLDAVLTREALT